MIIRENTINLFQVTENTAFNLTNKTILITGASSGIGRATAQVCASLGATLIITGRNETKLKETLLSLKGNHTMFAFDFENGDLEHFTSDKFDKIDGVVHSAGIVESIPFSFTSAAKLEQIMKINFIVPFTITQLLVSKKKIQKSGSVVFVSSIRGISTVSIGLSAYSSSKGALSAVVRVLALELAARKIRVNAICPGMIRTEMNLNNERISQEALLEDEKLNYPLGYGEAVDVANSISFLLSDASRWITGTNLVIDGGASIK